MEEAETLDDMDTPIIAYASPSMCNLLGYDTVRAARPGTTRRTTHTDGLDG
jgi:hypothetical protein